MVRITLTDIKSNKIAAVGYMKFKIVDTITESDVVLTPNFDFADIYTVNCTETQKELKLTWHQFEEQIIAQLEKQGISKEVSMITLHWMVV